MLGPVPVLHTSRLLLRPLRLTDAPAVFAYASEPHFFQFIDDVPAEVRAAYTMEHAVMHIRELLQLESQGYPQWGIVPAPLDYPVGAIRFKPAPGGGPELGYGLAREWRGRGLATEAVHVVVAWAADRWPGPLVARCDARNLASQAVLRGAGFVSQGVDARGRWVFERRRLAGS